MPRRRSDDSESESEYTGTETPETMSAASTSTSDDDSEKKNAPKAIKIKLPNIMIMVPPDAGQKRSRRARSRSRSCSPTTEDNEDPRTDEAKITENWTEEEYKYYRMLPKREKRQIIAVEKRVKNTDLDNHIPMRFKILNNDMDDRTKSIILSKIDLFQSMSENSGDYHKLQNYLNLVSKLPIGRYHKLPISATDPQEAIAKYLTGVRESLDNSVYGHSESKDQIMLLLSKFITNPNSQGLTIGLQGPMGCGKTTLIKDGLAKALNMPFSFIPLGGANDGSYLDGHSYVFEGSHSGKIAEVLMKTQYMNPIIYMDELEKGLQNRHGEEISNILIHLCDTSQNDKFNDKYFSEIDFDLSKAIFIFSYNDPSAISPILLDRMVTISVPGYTKAQKLEIARDYLIPKIYEQYSLAATDVTFTDRIINSIIDETPEEEGVRNLKRSLESIVSWLNMHRYLEPIIKYPVEVNETHVRDFVKKGNMVDMSRYVRHTMYT